METTELKPWSISIEVLKQLASMRFASTSSSDASMGGKHCKPQLSAGPGSCGADDAIQTKTPMNCLHVVKESYRRPRATEEDMAIACVNRHVACCMLHLFSNFFLFFSEYRPLVKESYRRPRATEEDMAIACVKSGLCNASFHPTNRTNG